MNTDRAIELAVELQAQAWNLQAEGKLEEAATACRKALLLLEESGAADSPDAANLLNDLAEIESERQNFQAALVLAGHAQEIEDRLGSGFSREDAARIRARTMGLIGEICRIRGDFVRAEASLKEALRIMSTQFGEASEEMAEARNNLAVLYKACGRFDEGLRLYQQALDSVVQIHGEDCLASSVIYHNIGGILHSKADFTSAEQPGRRAWEISRRLLGEDDPRTLFDAVAYAGILDGLQRYNESEAIYRRALAIFEKTFGPEHYEVAANLHNLAAVLCARGDLDQAEKLYLRALAIKEKLLGAGSPDAALTRNNIGALLNLQGRSREAAAMLQSAVEILQDRLAPDHPHLAFARANLQRAILSSRSQGAKYPKCSCLTPGKDSVDGGANDQWRRSHPLQGAKHD
jgi:tetratricopeptide (TPR) repeat protein